MNKKKNNKMKQNERIKKNSIAIDYSEICLANAKFVGKQQS